MISHVSITAHNANNLAQFYMKALEMRVLRPAKRLNGAVISRGNGHPNSNITCIWLGFLKTKKPFLEIMTYSDCLAEATRAVNAPGLAHIAFEVSEIHSTVEQVLHFGGSLQGEIVNLGSQERPNFCVYVRDPEGNVLELEQLSKGS
ncbi:MAG: VOC family protein [Pseudomonadota bacterium]